MPKKSKDKSAATEETRALIKKALMTVEDIDGLMDQLQRNKERAADVMRIHIFKPKKPKQGSN